MNLSDLVIWTRSLSVEDKIYFPKSTAVSSKIIALRYIGIFAYLTMDAGISFFNRFV